MNAPLVFYPADIAVRTQRLLAGAGGAAAALFLWLALRSSSDPLVWKLAWAALAVAGACAAGVCNRAARRVADARRNREPQLVIDDFGITLRGDFRWQPTRIAWSRIEAISAVPDDKGLSIVIEGTLKPFGSLVDVRVAGDHDADAIEQQLARFTPRLGRTHGA
ncbi:hypothetical protein ACG3SL_07240 [Sphingomonas sp. CJ20]